MSNLLQWLLNLVTTTPLPLFVFLGSILEEVIPPIPAPLVMSLAGHVAAQRGGTLGLFFLLAVVGAIGKTAVSLVLYFLGKRVHLFLLRHPRAQQFLGIEQLQLTSLQTFLAKKWWDDVLLVFLRIIPVIPTFLVSLGCGVIGVPLRTFIWTTCVGTVLRNLFLLWLGVYAAEYVQKFWEQEGQELSQQPLVISAGVIGLVLGLLLALRLKKYLRESKSRS